MEAAEKTLTYRHDTGLHKKLLAPDNKDNDQPAETHSDESNYVDLDLKPDGPKTVKVTFTGDGNQLSVIKCDNKNTEDFNEENSLDVIPEPVSVLETLIKASHSDQESEQSDRSEHVCSEELQYTDMYLNSRTESDEQSEHSDSGTLEDESHYITTHEIQLTEQDHDVDYDLGGGTCWEFEDDNLVYSFVDYASFESDETQEGTLILEEKSRGKNQSERGEAAVGTEQESDLCDSDESVFRNQVGEQNAQIHLSIKTSTRAVSDPLSVFEQNTVGYAKHFADRSHFSFVSSGARGGPLCDRSQYFIPAPGRQHLATKLRRKDINDYSSGASSSISELDDADKEVRNLTAKSFRSLACPYFDTINLSTSSESSVSEYGLNKWSAYVDWNYGNISRGTGRSLIARRTSSATLEMSKSSDNLRCYKTASGLKDPQIAMCALNKKNAAQLKEEPAHRGVRLNFLCRDPKCAKNEVSGTVLSRSGCELHADESGEIHKRAIFASSLLKNVISKKMQFEQERKMERGEICDVHPVLSPCCHSRDQVRSKNKHFQSSESGSAGDDPQQESSRPASGGAAEAIKAPQTEGEPGRSLIALSESSAFNSLKESEVEPVKESDSADGSQKLDSSSMLTKLLFVPSCQLISKAKELNEDLPPRAPRAGTPAGQQKSQKKTGDGSKQRREENKAGKTPEIKICLRSVKENEGRTLNIANLLTPKISSNANTLRAADESRCHILSAVDKVPNFTVRDIRDTKCKFQTPIYHVRDVRKLVKSSYRFVSLDNTESKCSAGAEKPEEKNKVESGKHLLPSPMVIKCNSVKTNVKSLHAKAPQRQTEVDAIFEASQNEHKSTNRVVAEINKHGNLDSAENQSNPENKLVKQRAEKFTSETTEKKAELLIPKQDALEKLRAAVKTMEQLYVFDKKEWKRKTQAPHPVADSHVLSLITREEQAADEVETSVRSFSNETGKTPGDKRALNIIHVPYDDDTFKTQSQQSKTFTNKSILHFGNKPALKTSSTVKNVKSPAAPMSVRVEPPGRVRVQQEKVRISPDNHFVPQICSDSENYLTMPGLVDPNETKELNREPATSKPNLPSTETNRGDFKNSEQRKSSIMEFPAANIYHHPTATGSPLKQQQMLHFSPSTQTVSPTPSAGDVISQTQRKMLLDPTTGHYYLVDTPIQATTKRLFDPETGQYVDIPMPHSPVAPVTPVPLSFSPLALSPGAYAPTYMIYPGFIPSPTLAPQTVMAQSPCHSEEATNKKKIRSPQLVSSPAGAEGAYYSPTGEAQQGALYFPLSIGQVSTGGGLVSSERKPLISITTQQGPRIIAPPSFDGKTMSFVVEHR